MARPLRDRDPENYHLVTVRTEEARIWMVPSQKVNEVIGGVLARYQELLRITIYAFCILGNHLHLLVHACDRNLDQYMENVLREIARRVNRLNDRRGHLWSRRYDDQVIMRQEDLLEAFLYVSTNAVKHGLVKDMRSWPGLSSYQLMDDNPRQYPFVHYSRRADSGKPAVSLHRLTLTCLPQHAGVRLSKRRALVSELIDERQQWIVRERLRSGAGFLGAKSVLRQPPGRIPATVSYSPRPICYTSDPKLRKEYRAERSLFRQYYCEASEKFRSGKLDTRFPAHCFKPPLHRSPRQRLAA